MKRRLLCVACFMLALLFCVSSCNTKKKLNEKYLSMAKGYKDAAKGLEVYLWEENEAWFSCMMSGTNRQKTPEEINAAAVVPLEEMAEILKTIPAEDRSMAVLPFLLSVYPTTDESLEYDRTSENIDLEILASLCAELGLTPTESTDKNDDQEEDSSIPDVLYLSYAETWLREIDVADVTAVEQVTYQKGARPGSVIAHAESSAQPAITRLLALFQRVTMEEVYDLSGRPEKGEQHEFVFYMSDNSTHVLKFDTGYYSSAAGSNYELSEIPVLAEDEINTLYYTFQMEETSGYYIYNDKTLVTDVADILKNLTFVKDSTAAVPPADALQIYTLHTAVYDAKHFAVMDADGAVIQAYVITSNTDFSVLFQK